MEREWDHFLEKIYGKQAGPAVIKNGKLSHFQVEFKAFRITKQAGDFEATS